MSRATAVRMRARTSGARVACRSCAGGGVVVAVGGAQAAGELVLSGAGAERAAEPGGGQRAGLGDPNPVRWRVIRSALGCSPSPKRAFICSSLTSEPAGTVQSCAMSGSAGSRPAGVAEGGQAAADPPSGGFAFGGVVVGQARPAALGGVGGGDLPDQVQVAVAGGQLVQAHHRAHHLGRRFQRPAVMRRPLPFRDLNARGVMESGRAR